MNYSWNITPSINRKVRSPKVTISNYSVFDSSNIDLKVLKGSCIFIKPSRASNRKTKPFNMTIKQVLTNKPSRAFFYKALTPCLIGVFNIIPHGYRRIKPGLAMQQKHDRRTRRGKAWECQTQHILSWSERSERKSELHGLASGTTQRSAAKQGVTAGGVSVANRQSGSRARADRDLKHLHSGWCWCCCC